MRIIVVSDTHGNYPLAVRAIDRAGLADHVIHLGDVVDDAVLMEHALGSPVIKVAGNCDLTSTAPKELCMSFARRNILITHGHRHNVKSGLSQLQLEARSAQSHVVLYGHTHVASIDERDGILFVNPGCFAEACSAKSFAILTITGNDIAAEIVPVE
ncbi:metallophosphoesterase [Geobacter luticola]|uniref:Phosphoesterase n=2 Tax=Geomobilimonas luticola TaxID=1114878 RepID=A0ABS5SBM0_9BACT|nr:metallophosphoesterase [Geomobilimonas luticola]